MNLFLFWGPLGPPGPEGLWALRAPINVPRYSRVVFCLWGYAFFTIKKHVYFIILIYFTGPPSQRGFRIQSGNGLHVWWLFAGTNAINIHKNILWPFYLNFCKTKVAVKYKYECLIHFTQVFTDLKLKAIEMAKKSTQFTNLFLGLAEEGAEKGVI